jgi:adenylate cyclase class 2
LRLRDAEGNCSLNYKKWHYDTDGRSNHCDEYETEISDIQQFRNVFKVLGFKTLVTVDKVRKSWNYQDYEISMDSIKDLGDFVEIEYKGEGSPDPKKTTNEMIEFLKSQNVGKIERNYLGYLFQLLFPEEVEWEEI